MQLINFKRYENKRKINRKKVITISVLTSIIIIAIILSSIYSLNRTFRNSVDKYIFRKDIQENNGAIIELASKIESNNVMAYDNYVGILNKSILTLYANNGNKEKELEVEISNCIYDASNKYLALAEKDGSKLELISGNNILWKIDVEGNIRKIFVNRNGYVSAVVTGTSYKNVVITYDPNGTELFKNFLAKTNAMDVEISNDNRHIAIAEIDTSGSFIQSNVKILSMEKAQTDPDNSTEYMYPAESKEIITSLKYQDNNKLLCLYNDSIHIIQNNKDNKILDISDSKNTFADIKLKDNLVYVNEKSSGLFANVDVNITNINNNKNSIYTTDSAVTAIKTFDNIIAINLGTEIHFINTNGWLIKKYFSSKEVKDIVIGTGVVGIVYSDKIEIIKL